MSRRLLNMLFGMHIAIYPTIYLTILWVMTSADASGLEVDWSFAGPFMVIIGAAVFILVVLLTAIYVSASEETSVGTIDSQAHNPLTDIDTDLTDLDNRVDEIEDDLMRRSRRQETTVIAVGVVTLAFLAHRAWKKRR
jgi:hypothetical protein